MFGYIIPDKPQLKLKDYALYRSLYCGICVTTGKQYGQLARMTTNYDVVFLSALLHNFLGRDVAMKDQRCALHRIKKRTIAQPDAITEDICAANIMLVYYNLTDDVLDEGGLKKRAARTALRRAYRKVAKARPELEAVVKEAYERLRELEREGCGSLDRAADPFACMMRGIAGLVAKQAATPELLDLSYGFGKWVYLIDAVDDLEKDFKKGQYNPYLAAFKDFDTREDFLRRHREDIEFSLNAAIQSIRENYAKLSFAFNRELTDNIVYAGVSARTRGVLEGTGRGKTPKV